MSILREAMTAYLSGLTTKTGNKIRWKDCAGELTIELIDADKEIYILRRYMDDFLFEYEYEADDIQKRIVYRNNRMVSRTHFRNGQMHGEHELWHHDGSLMDSLNYKNGTLHGKGIYNSQEVEYDNGFQIK